MSVLDRLRRHQETEPARPLVVLPAEVREILQLLRAAGSVTRGAATHQLTSEEAAALTGRTPKYLRRRAQGWREAQARGEQPEIRVSKTSEGHNSHWRYSEADCIAYGLRRGIQAALEAAAVADWPH